MYFDSDDKQYSQNQILRPPRYTQLEIETLIEKLGKNILKVSDFGAGTGRLTIPLLKSGFAVTAVDVSQKSLDKLKTLANNLDLKKLEISNSFFRTQRLEYILVFFGMAKIRLV
ncbi:methyltransferase domain-containing protein [Candidatus Shapirobacteria bacterium]|nr:methyltransferase domain-containing protein [Candidatus Shapirobacteria bacterium]